MIILKTRDVKYTYQQGKPVLRGISTELETGKLYAIVGPSGCGKTTLLSLLGGLDSPESGRIFFMGEDIEKTGLIRHRRQHVSFVFQSYNLIDYLTPSENVGTDLCSAAAVSAGEGRVDKGRSKSQCFKAVWRTTAASGSCQGIGF